MHCLNISQGRYGGYSHKNNNAYDLCGIDAGIDYFYADCTLEVVGVLPYKTTGFANTVFFYDRENDITLAMTHENVIPARTKVGAKYYRGEICYMEGTCGKATGNHIHLEIGRGLQKNKVKINNDWKLLNQVNIEDYFYIGNSIKVINTKGYNFSKGDDEVKTIHVDRVGMYLRESVRGKILAFVKKGESFTFDSLMPIPHLQEDGYQWFVGKKGNATYYMQYDSSCYWLE